MNLLEKILSRTIEEGECMLWTGSKAQKCVPQVHIDGRMVPVRRAIFDFLEKSDPAKPWLTTRCRNQDCVNPDHIRAMSSTDFHTLRSKIANQGANKSLRIAKLTAARRKAPGVKLNEELAAEIRLSDTPSIECAKQYGISRSLVQNIRAGRAWKSSNVFAALFR